MFPKNNPMIHPMKTSKTKRKCPVSSFRIPHPRDFPKNSGGLPALIDVIIGHEAHGLDGNAARGQGQE